MNKDYYLELVGMDIIHYESLNIYPVTYGEIKNSIGYQKLMRCFIPFQLSKDFIEITEKCTLEDNFNLFSDLIMKDENFLSNVAIILKIFCKPEKIYAKNNQLDLYDVEDNIFFSLTKDNFEIVADILLRLNGIRKLKAERPPANMSERQRDIWEKLQAGRAREAKKNEVTFYDVLNICEFAQYYISINEIKNWTIWKILNCYHAKVGQKTYDDNLKIGIASYDLKSISGKNHWFKQLMIQDDSE